MWFDQGSEILDLCRTSFFANLLLALPIFVSISRTCLTFKEFQAFRLQQFELHGSSYGTSGSLLNLETRILPGSRVVATRALAVLCRSPGGPNCSNAQRPASSQCGRDCGDCAARLVLHFGGSEGANPGAGAGDAGGVHHSSALFHHVHGNGVQLVSSLGSPKVMSDAQILSVQGALIGTKASRSFPILISTHYDSMSPAAELSYGGDSNGSGAVSLLELARVFSHLYGGRGGVWIQVGWATSKLYPVPLIWRGSFQLPRNSEILGGSSGLFGSERFARYETCRLP